MKLTRRAALIGLATVLAPLEGRAQALPDGRSGRLEAGDFGVVPSARGDGSEAFRALLAEAVRRRVPVLLPPGDYRISGIALPDGLILAGTPGVTRLLPSGEGPLLSAEDIGTLTLTGLTFGERADTETGPVEAGGVGAGLGLVDLRGVRRLTVERCSIAGGPSHGLVLQRCGGRVRDTDIEGVAGVGLFAIDSLGLSITGNMVADCGNGGILVHRSAPGADGTIVSGNRVSRIAARDGGTGQNGNGINVFRAGNVLVTGNHVSDCAFSAIRANAASDVLISANQCLRSGETAIYSEFGFEGAVVVGNVVDTAANGILIVNFDVGGRLATVGQNVVRNITGIGPYVHDGAGFGFGISVEADTAVTGNVVEQVARWGLVLGWGPYLRNVSVTGNVVRAAPIGCAVTVVEGAGTALIADTLFEGVREAIVGFRWTETITDDLVDGGSGAFPHLTLSGNRKAG